MNDEFDPKTGFNVKTGEALAAVFVVALGFALAAFVTSPIIIPFGMVACFVTAVVVLKADTKKRD